MWHSQRMRRSTYQPAHAKRDPWLTACLALLAFIGGFVLAVFW